MGMKAAWRALWRGQRMDERKAGPGSALVAFTGAGRAAFSARRYDAFAEEGYRKNVIAFMAVNEVARGAASVPFALSQRRGTQRQRIAEHPALDLLAHPNPMQSGAELLTALYGHLLLAGNAYLEAVGPAGKAPLELFGLRPDRMRVIPGANGIAAGYALETHVNGKAVRKEWRADPVSGRAGVLHLKTFNPLDDWYGLSPAEPAAFSIDQHNEAGRWNQALLQNGARPSGALVFEGELAHEQYARLKEEFAEKYEGAANAGRPLLLEGGLKWEAMGHSPKDMDFVGTKHTAARDIALAFGVPPPLLGIPGDNTYANLREARLALWEETIIPLARHAAAELSNWLLPMFGEGLALMPDLAEVPALSLRAERLWERLAKADWLTPEEKRALAGS